jgi:site-specific DNA-adenine methylase
VGGESVLLHVLKNHVVTGQLCASDTNTYLIGWFLNLKNRVDELLTHPTSIVTSALFFFLAGYTSYRTRKDGTYIGAYNKACAVRIDSVKARRHSQLFQRVQFRCEDFREAFARIEAGAFVYADPPDVNCACWKYDRNPFAHTALFALLRQLPAKGVAGAMSNHHAPSIREAFPSERHMVLRIRRSMGAEKGYAEEVVVYIDEKVC